MTIEEQMLWTTLFVNKMTLKDMTPRYAAELADDGVREYRDRFQDQPNPALGGVPQFTADIPEEEFFSEPDLDEIPTIDDDPLPEPTRKFKYGDRVICIESEEGYVEEGATGVVKDSSDPEGVMVHWDANDLVKNRPDQPVIIWYIHEDKIEGE